VVSDVGVQGTQGRGPRWIIVFGVRGCVRSLLFLFIYYNLFISSSTIFTSPVPGPDSGDAVLPPTPDITKSLDDLQISTDLAATLDRWEGLNPTFLSTLSSLAYSPFCALPSTSGAEDLSLQRSGGTGTPPDGFRMTSSTDRCIPPHQLPFGLACIWITRTVTFLACRSGRVGGAVELIRVSP